MRLDEQPITVGQKIFLSEGETPPCSVIQTSVRSNFVASMQMGDETAWAASASHLIGAVPCVEQMAKSTRSFCGELAS